ncbi:MAG: ribonuclease HIII [Myxococcales bacterium]|nr:ribonuclease HIII [Myxococcales bacterium]MCB9533968.1 ribonuclease HIII [Myxococcales bacterium]
MAQQSVTLRVPKSAASELRAALVELGLSAAATPPHARYQLRGGVPPATVTLYESGKLLVQSAAPEEVVEAAESVGGQVDKWTGRASDGGPRQTVVGGSGPFADAVAKLPSPAPAAWIGIDEAGKGDYFGPLVVTAARVHRDQLALLAELGVADSKSLSDAKVRALARQLVPVVPFKRVLLMPARYNELYAKTKNLNRLLAWAHGAAAEKLLEAGVEAELILSDQFAATDLISGRLGERGRTLRFTQRTRAEEDPAVACASIYARAEFLIRLEQLESEFAVKLHKGAGPPVVAAGRALVREKGRDLLPSVAKVHFKTTGELG